MKALNLLYFDREEDKLNIFRDKLMDHLNDNVADYWGSHWSSVYIKIVDKGEFNNIKGPLIDFTIEQKNKYEK